VDQCFVRDITRSAEARLIVKAVIDLAHGMGLAATAEGVEDVETLSALRDMGCDDVQGFLIAEAMDGRDLVGWLLRFEPPALLVSHLDQELRPRSRAESILV
jgi:EAL domain-containing protein (putative c-di-GMP-specific phosphodiesterase class I)